MLKEDCYDADTAKTVLQSGHSELSHYKEVT